MTHDAEFVASAWICLVLLAAIVSEFLFDDDTDFWDDGLQ